MKYVSASGSLKGQLLPSLLLASFFKVLPLPQKLTAFASTSLFLTQNSREEQLKLFFG